MPLRGTAGCLPAPALGGLCGQPQYSKRASSALPAQPKISKACGAPEEEEKKVFITAKTTRRLLRSTAGFAFLDRAGERATDLLSHSRADKRLAEIGTKRCTAEHEQKHGVEQSTASSRAVSKQHVRTRHEIWIELQIAFAAQPPKFRPAALRSCARGAYFQRGTRRTEEMVASMTFTRSKSGIIVVGKVQGVDMGVRYANIGNKYAIMTHFMR